MSWYASYEGAGDSNFIIIDKKKITHHFQDNSAYLIRTCRIYQGVNLLTPRVWLIDEKFDSLKVPLDSAKIVKMGYIQQIILHKFLFILSFS